MINGFLIDLSRRASISPLQTGLKVVALATNRTPSVNHIVRRTWWGGEPFASLRHSWGHCYRNDRTDFFPMQLRDLVYETRNQAAWITLNRPRLLNACRRKCSAASGAPTKPPPATTT